MADRNSSDNELLVTAEAVFRTIETTARRLPLVIGVSIVTAIAVFGVLSLSPPKYSAEALLVVSSPFKEDTKRSNGGSEVTDLLPVALSVQDYQIIALSDPILKKLREEGNWVGDSGNPIDLQQLRQQVNANINVIEDNRVDKIYSPVLKLSVQTTEAQKTADLVNTWAEITVAASRAYGQSSVVGLQDFFVAEFDEAKMVATYRRLYSGAMRIDL